MRLECILTVNQIEAIIEWSRSNERDRLHKDEATAVVIYADADINFDVTKIIIRSIL